MKTPAKALVWTAAGLAALTSLIWLGSFLYWHVRITSSLRRWKEELKSTGGHHSTLLHQERGFLHSAGCRAMPYAAAALDANDDDPRFQEALMQYLISALSGPGPYTPENVKRIETLSSRWEFIADGLDLERRGKVADFRAWWHENGHKYHAWWRTWSGWCGGN